MISSFLSPAAYTVVYATISICFVLALKKRASLDFLNPGIVFAILLYAYSIASALYVRENGTTGVDLIIDNETMYYYYASCLAGLLGLGFGILWGQNCRTQLMLWKPTSLKFSDRCQTRKLVIYTLIVGVLFAPFYYKSFNPASATLYSDRALEMRIEHNADTLSGITTVLAQQTPSILIIGCATYLIFRSKRLLFRFTGLLIMTLYMLTNTMSGWRNVVVQAATVPLIFFHYRVRRLPLISLLLIGAGAWVFMDFAAIARGSNDPAEMLARVTEQFTLRGTETLDATQSAELLTATNLMNQIAATRSGQLHYSYGASILTELAVFVPRAFYPDRPLPLSEQYLKELFPDVLADGAGYGFFCLQEGYWSFGIIGVFLFMLGYGWALQVVYRWFQQYMWSDVAALLYATVFYALVVSAVRSGLIGNFKSLLMGALPFIFVLVMPDLFGPGDKRARNWLIKPVSDRIG